VPKKPQKPRAKGDSGKIDLSGLRREDFSPVSKEAIGKSLRGAFSVPKEKGR
jgi:hypothetical protein